MTLGVVTELVTRAIQARVFVLLPFDGARLAAAGPRWNRIGDESVQEILPQFASQAWVASLADGAAELA